MEENKNVPMIMDDVLSTSIQTDNNVQFVENPMAVGATKPQQIVIPPKIKTIIRKYNRKIGRNDICPCGSGKKYKNCCLKTEKYEEHRQLTVEEMAKLKNNDCIVSKFKEAI